MIIRRSHRSKRLRPVIKIIARRTPPLQTDDNNQDSGRCPVCGHRLVARQGRQGPYFFCLCTKRLAA
jgi:DNA-directed RNA polymerase subunit RPC12/RpoP